MTIANRADIHEALARAYDKEDAAQRGEPDPWTEDADPEWRAERLACAQVALKVALPEIRRAVLAEFARFFEATMRARRGVVANPLLVPRSP